MAPAEREFRRYEEPFDDPYPEPVPPPAPRASLLPYVAFLLAVAVVSLGVGYALNKAVAPKPAGPRPEVSAGPTGAAAGLPTGPPGATPPPDTSPGGGTGAGSAAGGGLTGLTAEQVAIRLAAAGLPLRTTTVYTAASDPEGLLGRTGGYSSKIAFADPRVGRNEVSGLPADAIERGGHIEVFADPARAQARLRRIQTVTADHPEITEYAYAAGTVVLRLSLVLDESMAQRYQAALTAIGA